MGVWAFLCVDEGTQARLSLLAAYHLEFWLTDDVMLALYFEINRASSYVAPVDTSYVSISMNLCKFTMLIHKLYATWLMEMCIVHV